MFSALCLGAILNFLDHLIDTAVVLLCRHHLGYIDRNKCMTGIIGRGHIQIPACDLAEHTRTCHNRRQQFYQNSKAIALMRRHRLQAGIFRELFHIGSGQALFIYQPSIRDLLAVFLRHDHLQCSNIAQGNIQKYALPVIQRRCKGERIGANGFISAIGYGDHRVSIAHRQADQALSCRHICIISCCTKMAAISYAYIGNANLLCLFDCHVHCLAGRYHTHSLIAVNDGPGRSFPDNGRFRFCVQATRLHFLHIRI